VDAAVKAMGDAGARGDAARGPGDTAKGPLGVADGSLEKVMRSLEMSIGPKAAYSQLTEVGKAVQLAAVSQDPLDADMMRMMLESLREVRDAIKELKDPPRGRHDG
jgi:hypothetical protein